MHMFYWLGIKLEDFLFQGYSIITTWEFILTCIFLSALAILYEAMKISHIKLKKVVERSKQAQNLARNTDSSSLLSRVSEMSIEVFGTADCDSYVKQFVEIFHWTFHITLGYILMLAIMTYNGYISIALVIGSGIGYYIFGPILLELRLLEIQKQKNYKNRKLEQCNPECADAVTNDRGSVTSIVPENTEPENANINVEVHV